MNQIKEVYSRVTADESVVDAAIENAKKQKITRFSAGRIAAVAASFAAVILAAGLILFLLQTKTVDLTSRTADAGAAEEVVVLEEEAPAEEAAGDQDSYSKNAGAVLSYHSEEVPVLGATEIRSGREDLTVTYHVSGDESYDPAEITLRVFDADRNEVQPVTRSDVLSEDGSVSVTESFSPVNGDRLTLRYYDGGTLVKEEEITLTAE